MNWSNTTLSLITLSIVLPSSAILPQKGAFANTKWQSAIANIQVRTDKVQVTSQSDGNINVNTGKTSVSVPTRRHSTWYPLRYWRTPQRSNCHRSYQQTTQLSNSGKKVVQHSSTNYCR